jgi:hypothetical protein
MEFTISATKLHRPIVRTSRGVSSFTLFPRFQSSQTFPLVAAAYAIKLFANSHTQLKEGDAKRLAT